MLSALVLIGAIAFALYKWATVNNDYFKRRDVKSMKPKLLLGNSDFMFRKMSRVEVANNFYNEFPNET